MTGPQTFLTRTKLRPERALLRTLAGIILIGGAASFASPPALANQLEKPQEKWGPVSLPEMRKSENIAKTGKQSKTRRSVQTQQQEAEPAQNGSVLFMTHAAQAGAKNCAATYANLGKSLTGGAQFMLRTQTDKVETDSHALKGIVGMNFSGSEYDGPAAGFVFAVPSRQGCEGGMVRVVPFPANCQLAAALLPQGSTPLQPLLGISVFSFASGGQAMLMPTDRGCVAISILTAQSLSG